MMINQKNNSSFYFNVSRETLKYFLNYQKAENK